MEPGPSFSEMKIDSQSSLSNNTNNKNNNKNDNKTNDSHNRNYKNNRHSLHYAHSMLEHHHNQNHKRHRNHKRHHHTNLSLKPQPPLRNENRSQFQQSSLKMSNSDNSGDLEISNDTYGTNICGDCKYDKKCMDGCRYGVKKSTQQKKCKWCGHPKCHGGCILSTETSSSYTSTCVSDSSFDSNRLAAPPPLEEVGCKHSNMDNRNFCYDCNSYPFSKKSTNLKSNNNNTKNVNHNRNNTNISKKNKNNSKSTVNNTMGNANNGLNNENSNNNTNKILTESEIKSKYDIIFKQVESQLSEHSSEDQPSLEYIECDVTGNKVCKYDCQFSRFKSGCIFCGENEEHVKKVHKLSDCDIYFFFFLLFLLFVLFLLFLLFVIFI